MSVDEKEVSSMIGAGVDDLFPAAARLQTLAQLACDELQADGAIILGDDDALMGRAGEPPPSQLVDWMRMNRDAAANFRDVRVGGVYASVLRAVVVPDGKAVGTLCVFSRDERRATDETRARVAALAPLIADQVEAARAVGALRERIRALAERHRLLSAAVEGFMEYPLSLLDADGRIAVWSAAAALRTGYDANEAVGKPFSILYEDDTSGWLELAHVQSVRVRARCRRRRGPSFDAYVAIDAIHDSAGAFCGFIHLMLVD